MISIYWRFSLQLTIVGSGTAVPQRNRSAPCCLIRHEDEIIVVDLGPGSTRGALVHGRVTVREIGLILITHLHLDHCGDLAALLFALRAGELGRTGSLRILGPEGLRGHFKALHNLWGHHVEPMNYELAVDEWNGEELSWGAFRISAAQTVHSVLNLAWLVRIPGKTGVIVTGDGEPTEELVEMGCSAGHVLVAECSLAADEKVTGHMNPGKAGELARRCRSEKLVLTHMNPGVQTGPAAMEAKKQYGGEVIVAEDGMMIEV
jgi:ribonuclease BN (tRNA processing enzyme)